MANYMTPLEAMGFDIENVKADVAAGTSRLIGVNLWRIITDHPNEASPLAICDNATVSRDDVIKIGALEADNIATHSMPCQSTLCVLHKTVQCGATTLHGC